VIFRRLGRTGLKVSLMGLGSGGHNRFGQFKGVAENEIHRLVHHALDLGINLFDTSPGYWDSELILGRALKGIPRDHYILSTKVPLLKGWGAEDVATSDEVVESVENSLRRLGVDAIDLILAAGFVSDLTYRLVANDLFPVLEKLQKDGKVRYIGASEKSSDDGAHEWLERALQDDLCDVVMVAYNMINQSAERVVFPMCREKDVGVLNIFTVRNVFSNPDRLKEVIQDFKARGVLMQDALSDHDPLGWLLEGDEDSLVGAAYRFVAGNHVVSCIMTGTINVDHLDQNVKALEKPPLPDEKVHRLRQLFGHIAEPVGN